MKNATASHCSLRVVKSGLRFSVLTLSLAAALQSRADELIKADNTTNLALQASYTNASADTATGDTIRFDNTLVNNGTFSWSADNVTTLKVIDPTLAITINMTGGSTYSLANSAGGTVIDMSAATQNLTLSNGNLRVRGDATNGATFSIANGRTLTIQSKLTYNNGSGLASIRVTGAGNVTVSGVNGAIQDKDGANFTAFKHEGGGTVTFSNANTYSGGTTLASGTLVAGNAKALGDGAVTVNGGTLDLNGAGVVNLTLAGNKDFTFSNGTLKLDLGTSSDQITGGGSGKFSLTGGTFALTLGTGFDYGIIYQLFNGFDSATSVVNGLAFTGFDSGTYQASLNTLGQLSFSAIPEPSTYAAIAGGLFLAGAALRRRR